MSPNPVLFLVFMATVPLLYYLIHCRAQNALLLVASYLPCYTWNYSFLGLLVAFAALAFFYGQAIGVAQSPAARKVRSGIRAAGGLQTELWLCAQGYLPEQAHIRR